MKLIELIIEDNKKTKFIINYFTLFVKPILHILLVKLCFYLWICLQFVAS
jgi:hypothetical protein